MSRAKFTQCLLFSAHERHQDAAAAQSSTASSIKYYALLPEVFKTEHPEVLKIFTGNDVVVISDSDDSSLQFVGRDEIEVIEVILRVNPTTIVNNVSLIVEDLNLRVVRDLVFSNTSVDINSYSKATKVYPAVDDSNASVIKHILCGGTDIRYKHPLEESLLHLAARRGHETLAQIIIEHGTNVNLKCRDGSTPLYVAVCGGHREVVHMLIQNGANVNSKTSNKSTSLHAAAEKRLADIVEVLLQNGASVESKTTLGLTALHVAAEGGHRRVVEILLQNGANIESKTESGSTALYVAVKKDHWNVAEVLLRYGADRDTENKTGSTALHVAVARGHLDMVEVILENGAEVNCQNRNGRTPLFIAAKKGRLEIVRALLSYGACLDAKLTDGRFIIQDAAVEEHLQTFQCLLDSTFHNPEILTKTGALGYLHKKGTEFSDFGTWKYEYSCHILKVIHASSYPLTPFSQLRFEDEFRAECEAEVDRMKRLTIGNTKTSFFDVLTKDICHIARYLKNRNVAQILSSDNLNHTFPKYRGILKSQFRKASRRKLACDEGLKIIHTVSGLFDKLPREIKEKIFDYLSVRDILILKHARAHTNA